MRNSRTRLQTPSDTELPGEIGPYEEEAHSRGSYDSLAQLPQQTRSGKIVPGSNIKKKCSTAVALPDKTSSTA